MSSAARDKIRGAIFATKPKVTEVPMEDGTVILVKQPLVGQMLDLVSIEDNKVRMSRMLVACCFLQETGEAVFEDSDSDGLMNLPSGTGPYQKLMDAVQDNMGLNTQLKEAEKK